MGRPVGARRRRFGTAAKLQLGRRHGFLCKENETRGRSGRSSRRSEEKRRRRRPCSPESSPSADARCSGSMLGRTGMRAAVGGNWLRA
uniref:Uncharacterized protein n=1 Tax=Triticum urartu TaxID=4572 RepID=A0A8R7UIM8_TRIUA